MSIDLAPVEDDGEHVLGRGGPGEVVARLAETVVSVLPAVEAGVDLALYPDQAGAYGGEAVNVAQAPAEVAKAGEGLFVVAWVLAELEEAGEEGEGV